jgi:hypothetical protein
MQFLKILFWCLLAFLAAAFTIGNWVAVPIRLPGGLVADVNLPFLLLATFLAGLLPTLGWQAARRWRLKQRLATCERVLAETRAAHTPVVPADPGLTPDLPPPSATLAAPVHGA